MRGRAPLRQQRRGARGRTPPRPSRRSASSPLARHPTTATSPSPPSVQPTPQHLSLRGPIAHDSRHVRRLRCAPHRPSVPLRDPSRRAMRRLTFLFHRLLRVAPSPLDASLTCRSSVTLVDCSNCSIFVGAVGGAVSVDSSEKLTLTVAAKRARFQCASESAS
jgi:hypothetical protein